MAPNTAHGSRVLLHVLLCSLLATISFCSEDDIKCLESIKLSLGDPKGYLNFSWNFNNNSEEGFICHFIGVECWHPNKNEVLNIRLSNMNLKGQFPLGIEKCRALTGLDLSNNELSGPIPSNISKILPFLTSLDVSSNKFSGTIPEQIVNCSFLNFLKLDYNQLTGRIPPELDTLSRLKSFSVTYNQLYGSVPNFRTHSFSESSYDGNLGLCGFPLQPCSGNNSRPTPNFKDSFKSGFVIGYTVSLVSVISIFMSYCVPWMHRDERKQLVGNFMLDGRSNKGEHSYWTSQLQFTDILHEASREISMLGKLVSRMSYTDLREATNEFSANNIVGFGQMGITYKAILSNGWILAVKKLFDTQKFDEYFITELKTLGRLRHDNLVPLLGFCIESKEKFLVYKYMPNGNLYDWLHPMEGRATKIIEWPLRVKIACGIARGLVCLHQNYNFRVIHLDISSKCILLDHDFEPKISNFGEAMLLNSNYTHGGSGFSIYTEYWEQRFIKEDVYRFGIVLLELVTGKDPSKLTNSSHTGDGTLNEWVNSNLSSSNFYHVIEKSLIGRGFDLEIFQIYRVACNCVQSNPYRRPTMLEVHKAITVVGKNSLENEVKAVTKGKVHLCNKVGTIEKKLALIFFFFSL